MFIDKFKMENTFMPHVNTGTIWDLATGKFQPGVLGKYYLNGGLHYSNVFMGRVQTYKSGIAGSLLTRALINYPDSFAIVYETEFNVPGATRYDDFIPAWYKNLVSDRIAFRDASAQNFGEFFETIQELGREKEKHKKDMIVESPFVDVRTMKPNRMWIPTFVLTDSWSKASSGAGLEKYEDKKIESSEMNTFFLNEGMIKTRVNRILPNLAAKYGIYFICTAHVDDVFNMDPRSHPMKALQYMRQNDKLKNVGGDFEFLTENLLQTINANAILESTKTNSYYPNKEGGPATEVCEVNANIVKCKNNASGTSLQFIVSQYQGILNDVTNFHYLKKCKDYGMKVSGRNNYNLDLYPEKTLHRTTIRNIVDESYETRRALELTTQLCFIQNNWFTANMPESIRMPITKFAEKLTKTSSPTIDDVLNSTGCWTIGKHEKRKYMSIFDIAEAVFKM